MTQHERKDKGTERELTELAKTVTAQGQFIITDVRQAQKDVENGESVGITFANLEESISSKFRELRDIVLSYDQRDRLEKDKEE